MTFTTCSSSSSEISTKSVRSSYRLGEAARMEQLSLQNLQGGKDYRPLVGGFAAAAYEAMKEHHYLKDETKSIDMDTKMRQNP
eukprot:CAMPEP_0198265184 /NCGR_PEP_ID=MMETSP1447-20131203/20808_1 /TAXON_ID=420782 /ORGANISM="Chaetoceros dichaeta, Strain CCMP1751" /LENGTH=82 /DNA_ID=CAMNT_0043954515 /DNA_START=80 /DNA_END=328 /DNA_ORIENTATION=+